MSLLELRGVEKSYRQGGQLSGQLSGLWNGGTRRRVLRGLDLKIDEGECLGLVGRSGCGKSTLGRIVLGLERPDAGQALLDGRDRARVSGREARALRRMVQVVFQDAGSALNPRLTVFQSLSEPLVNFDGLYGAPLRARAGELLEMVGLSPRYLDSLPQQLSGGQQQRVCIARALAPRPRLLVLDEALSCLDMLTQARVLDLLEDLRRRTGVASLFISHDLRLVRQVAHRVAVLHDGRLDEAAGQDMDTLPGLKPLLDGVLPPLPAAR